MLTFQWPRLASSTECTELLECLMEQIQAECRGLTKLIAWADCLVDVRFYPKLRFIVYGLRFWLQFKPLWREFTCRPICDQLLRSSLSVCVPVFFQTLRQLRGYLSTFDVTFSGPDLHMDCNALLSGVAEAHLSDMVFQSAQFGCLICSVTSRQW